LAVSPEPTPDVSKRAPASRSVLPVGRRVLFAIGAAVWTGVGVLLLVYTATWLAPVTWAFKLGLGLAGLVVAAVFVRFVFGGIVRKNIVRIDQGPARASAFAFQGWKSYLVTVFMIGLGIGLRHSAIPKPGLAVVYEGIGIALLLTSALYYRRVFASSQSRAPKAT
jgi:hypothetical protein